MEWIMISWLIGAVFFFLLETSQVGFFYFLSFSIGAVAAFGACFFGLGALLQVLVFGVASAVSLVFLKRFVTVLSSYDHAATNVSALIGKTGIVTHDLVPAKFGRVKIGGESWAAREIHGCLVPKGSCVRVVDVVGCHVIVQIVI